MAGIPVHTSSPINPNAISLPQAAPTATSAPTRTGNWPATVQVNSTAIATNSIQSAQPGGGVPAPAPTSTASSQYTPYSSYTPTPTRTIPAPPPVGTRHSPPPPQPGQAPSPRSTSRNTRRPSYPEPPQPAAQPSDTMTNNPLPQLQTNYPLPTARVYEPFRAQPPASTTMTMPSYTQIQDLSHPPGYKQDSLASFHDRPIEEVENKTHTPSPTRRGMGLLDSDPIYDVPAEDSPIWDTAVSWAKAAGKRLSVGEAQIWKAINGEK